KTREAAVGCLDCSGSDLGLVVEQDLALLLQPALQGPGDQGQETREHNLDPHRLLEDVDPPIDALTHGLDRVVEAVADPGGLHLADLGELVSQLAKALLDAPTRFGSAQLMRNGDDKRLGHGPRTGSS